MSSIYPGLTEKTREDLKALVLALLVTLGNQDVSHYK